jgi:hypothetical protein
MWPFTQSRKAKEQTYQDLGVRLIATLVTQLRLPGWGTNLLPTYSADEISAIDSGCAAFQRLADEEGGGAAGATYFHPEAAHEIRRKIAGDELMSYADRLCRFSEKLPADWKQAASAYLKAWSATLEPSSLQNLGELLAKAGCVDAARETFNVILAFPPYAPKVYGNQHDDLVRMIVEHARESLNAL